MTGQELEQIRGVMRQAIAEAVAPIEGRLDSLSADVAGLKTDIAGFKASTDTRFDGLEAKMDEKFDLVLAGIVRLKTDVLNRDASHEIRNLRERVEALEGPREQ